MKNNLKKLSIGKETSLGEAMQLMGESEERILLITNKEKKLLGTVTDGDIRRALIRQVDNDKEIVEIMNHNPVTAYVGTSKKDLLSTMVKKDIIAIPIIDESGLVVDIQSNLSRQLVKF